MKRNTQQTIAGRLRHEIAEAVPPAIFFFVAFQIIALTQALLLEQYGIRISVFVTATVAALLVAKVVLLADMLPFVNRYPDRPLAWNVAWKTLIYITAALLVRVIEHVVKFWLKYGEFTTAMEKILEEVVWTHFWYVMVWLVVLFVAYASARELVRALGGDRVRQLFFGPKPPQTGRGSQRAGADA